MTTIKMRKGDLFADIADNPDSIKMAQGEGFSIVDETPPTNESPTNNEPTEDKEPTDNEPIKGDSEGSEGTDSDEDSDNEPTEDKESAKPTARRGRPARN